MKKLLVLVFLLFPCIALADWSVTTSWTASVGPGLAYEEVLLDGVSQCSVSSGQPTTCNFVVTALGGSVMVRSYDGSGNYADTATITIGGMSPATGFSVTTVFIP